MVVIKKHPFTPKTASRKWRNSETVHALYMAENAARGDFASQKVLFLWSFRPDDYARIEVRRFDVPSVAATIAATR
jgi:hypothetical protein